MKLLVFLLLPCLSLSEISSGFAKCYQFFLNNDPPKFTPSWGTTVKEICQCVWDENDEQKFVYATLYNTDWKIPIYSAYVFDRSEGVGRCDVWYIEPQLDDPNAEPCMAPSGRKSRNNQAMNRDYKGQDPNKPKYDKGHLYPVQHTYDHISMLATSTLTNAAPQDSEFNRGAWKYHEAAVIEDLESCGSKAYVVAGVVPDTNKRLNKRVTVSWYYWRATCCLKNGEITGQGYFGPDNNNNWQKLTITALQKQLKRHYSAEIEIFPNLPTGYKISPTGGCK
ncbi:endonuclease domain-containing 1 protein-like [Pimephales promelas]|uniref:endonuclease domain-containing 1 protein-like n=1 Tax=Pimephales promelas TaxID=90988 RepID=UPI0019555C0F|nr:endonuclease domain-containing 1 protein-like [Pimephales promelas]KAG1934008.1 endonuclease domain-containing 1 protein-like [Pimephales promelas]